MQTNANSTTCSKLISHLSRQYPEQEHEKFYLNYRLFSDTSSHAPGADINLRAFTHSLAISREPRYAFIRTTKIGEPEDGQTITIPAAFADSFSNLVLSRLQPLWNPRSALSVENGVSVSLRDDQWHLCLGEVRVAAKQQAAGTLRGLLVELCMKNPGSLADGSSLSDDQIKEAQEMFQNVLNTIFEGTGENFDNTDFTVSMTRSRSGSNHDQGKSEPDWDLANIYMKVLKGQR